MSDFGAPLTVASADGTPIAYWPVGAGPALVVVHGLASEHYGWRQFGTLLSDRFTVCLMDRRGRNASGDTLPYGLEREAEDVIAVVEAAGGAAVAEEPLEVRCSATSGTARWPAFLGHSIAGPIVLEAALRTPAVSSLISYEGWMPEGGEVPADFLSDIDTLVDAGRVRSCTDIRRSTGGGGRDEGISDVAKPRRGRPHDPARATGMECLTHHRQHRSAAAMGVSRVVRRAGGMTEDALRWRGSYGSCESGD